MFTNEKIGSSIPQTSVFYLMRNTVQVNSFCKHNIVGVINMTEIDAKEKTYNTEVTELKWNTRVIQVRCSQLPSKPCFY